MICSINGDVRSELMRLDRVCVRINHDFCLHNITFSAYEGECLMFLSANGITCSRMVALLSGKLPYCSGNIYLWNRSVPISAPNNAAKANIWMVSENARLVDSFTILENLYLPERRCTFSSPQKKRILYTTAQKMLIELGMTQKPSCLARGLSIFEQHLVLAIKAILNGARILLFDNVTSTYADKDIVLFSKAVSRIKEMGLAVIIITRSITDAIYSADRIMVLRENTLMHVFRRGAFDRSQLFYCMTYQRKNRLEERPAAFLQPKLRLCGFVPKNCLCACMDITFYAGCVTGLLVKDFSTGIAIAQALFGMRSYDGQIRIDEKCARIPSTSSAIRQGIGLLYGSAEENLLMHASAMENLMLLAYRRTCGPMGILRTRMSRFLLDNTLKSFPIAKSVLQTKDIRTLPEMELMRLSIAKWLVIGVKIMVVLYPYSQLDEAHRLEFNTFLMSMKRHGITVIVLLSLSSDVESVCDEVIVC